MNDMPDRLRLILDYKAAEVARLRSERSETGLLADAAAASAPRGFGEALLRIAAGDGNALICEVKRKSPSAGDISPGRDPVSVANAYAAGGAACISVLTDGPSFGGALADMRAVREAVDLPVLRKDFMIDPIQLIEARAHGADAILIILSAVDDALARDLHACAEDLGMSVLLEVHDANELRRALELPSPLIGVNNRDLKRMVTDLAVTERLAADVPEGRLLISESGVRTAADLVRLRACGARGFLVGETLMRSGDPEGAVRAMALAR
jgi:indole-3-glycerol phosphate synthase